MLKAALVTAAFALSAGFANAATIEAGKVYVGDYTFVGVSPDGASCCPVLSIDSPIRAAQYNVSLGPDNLDPGETISLRFNRQIAPPPGDEDRNLTEFTAQLVTTSAGLGISSIYDDLTSGQIEIRAFGGSFDIRSLAVFGVVDATVQTTDGPLATSLGILAAVTNVRELPPPPPPPPSPVPLPAALPLMLAGLLGLGLLGRRRKVA